MDEKSPKRYLIADLAGKSIADLLDELRKDPEIRVVDTPSPDIASVLTPPAHAKELQAKYRGRVVIEPDAGLAY